MKPFEITAHLNSLQGETATVQLLGEQYLFGQPIRNAYIFNVGNRLCTGILNWFVCEYYVDDLYGMVGENDENYRLYQGYLRGKSNEA